MPRNRRSESLKQKVLVVEDEVDTAALLKHVLEREGFSIL